MVAFAYHMHEGSKAKFNGDLEGAQNNFMNAVDIFPESQEAYTSASKILGRRKALATDDETKEEIEENILYLFQIGKQYGHVKEEKETLPKTSVLTVMRKRTH